MTPVGKGRIGIIVGGGPAPGINGVIGSVTIEAENIGYEVIGFNEGFKYLSRGERNFVNLTTDAVSRIHLTGGSILKTSRVNPTKDPKLMENVVKTLVGMNINHLVTIGGDDTAFSSARVSDYAKEVLGFDLSVVHVPKTIDDDLPLPDGIPTFGFQTAREIGSSLVENLNEDAKTTGRWYIIVMMGRTAGHLALGVGKSAGATVILIPEEFEAGVRLKKVADILAGSIIKRLTYDKPYGVAVVAEGLAEKIAKEDLADLANAERDAHGHVRLAEIDFSDIVKNAVKNVLKEFNVPITLVDKEIGYELRCAPPVAFDIEYTRNLGYAAVNFLKNGGNKAIISIQEEKIAPIPFDDVRDPVTGRTKIRLVNTDSLQYQIAREYMIRLDKNDFEDRESLERLANAAGVRPEEFKKRFEYVVK